MKVLIIRTDHLGDVVLMTPLVRALALAGHQVSVTVPRAVMPVFSHNPRLTACHAMEDIAPNFPQSWRSLSRWLRTQQLDVLILPQAGSKQLLWASALSGIPTRIAMWAGVWGRLTGHRCLRSGMLKSSRHFSDIVLDCARALGLPGGSLAPEIFLTPAEKDEGVALCHSKFPGWKVIGLHPGCAGNTCNLPAAEYGRLADLILTQSECAIVITGLDREKNLLQAWPKSVLESPRVWNSMGQLDLRQLMAMIDRLAVFVCPSTGPLHLASALGIKTVSPFCSRPGLNHQVWGNLGGPAEVIEAVLPDCRLNTGKKIVCDFRGAISAEALWIKTRALLG